jgi:hypothetical protein
MSHRPHYFVTHRIIDVVEATRRGVLRALVGMKLWPPVRIWSVFARRFQYRGLALLLFALAFVGVGVGLPHQPAPAPELLLSLIPMPLRVTLWVGCGIVAAVGAVSHRTIWQDRGFAVLLAPLFGERFLSYFGAMLVEPDTLRWLSGAVVYALFSGLVTLIAAWPEPSVDPPPSPPLMPEV